MKRNAARRTGRRNWRYCVFFFFFSLKFSRYPRVVRRPGHNRAFLMSTVDYDSDDVPSSLMNDSSSRKIYVEERSSRKRRSLTQKTASSERFSTGEEEEEECEQLAEPNKYRRDVFQTLDYDDR